MYYCFCSRYLSGYHPAATDKKGRRKEKEGRKNQAEESTGKGVTQKKQTDKPKNTTTGHGWMVGMGLGHRMLILMLFDSLFRFTMSNQSLLTDWG